MDFIKKTCIGKKSKIKFSRSKILGLDGLTSISLLMIKNGILCHIFILQIQIYKWVNTALCIDFNPEVIICTPIQNSFSCYICIGSPQPKALLSQKQNPVLLHNSWSLHSKKLGLWFRKLLCLYGKIKKCII